ncbi:XrtA/PEP-CTERM system-associated ATPase [Geobacter argillaceus]|uniref:Putative secretion ATPase (PEP-CTERM system associated) n=1 Tax=Geobacter argillaceus TaxID=345631 RepID=A0A562VHR4_9BACT|nr:XrtA/PEP-CTERM system-associated ATPase [Geobacter argillaceus]TWJ17324.1 putative secretion ATPase (PEP-CTERM system associated) [Geobacter argillaceus]
MYETFFNLTTKPFDLVPNPDFIYLSRVHKKALTYLDYGVRERAGFILLTGEVGCGKTTLIRELLNMHHEHTVISKIFNTKVDSEQLIAMINDDFGLSVQGKDRITLLRELNDFLIDQYAVGNRPVLIIDEAQNLSPELLEEVRMLSNLETAHFKLLQIILVGQPELRTFLAAPELRQLRQRISINCHLSPLTRMETEQYILHRLEVAGNRDAVKFSPATFDIIYHYCRGVPRLTNIICDFLMLSAFAEERRDIDDAMAQEIVGDLDFDNYYWAHGQQVDQQTLNTSACFIEDGTIPANSVTGLFMEISEKINRLEQDVFAEQKNQAKEFNERLTTMQNALKSVVVKTDEALNVLLKKVNQLGVDADASKTGEQSPIDDKQAKSGLVRRIFGS